MRLVNGAIVEEEQRKKKQSNKQTNKDNDAVFTKIDHQIWLLDRAFEHSSGSGKAMLKLRIDRRITSVGYV